MERICQYYLENPRVCIDTRRLMPGDLFFALPGSQVDGHQFVALALEKGASCCVVSNSEYVFNKQCILVEDVLTALQELARIHRKSIQYPIIALTGSNGKTTTKDLIKTLLALKYKVMATAGNYNNHIGVALTLLSFPLNLDMGIVEMGANHVGEIGFLCTMAQPNYGLITNIGNAHLEGFGGIEGVFKGKTELYNYLIENNGVAFVDGQQENLLSYSEKLKKVVYNRSVGAFSLKENLSQTPLVFSFYDNHKNIRKVETNLVGAYNTANVLAALCIAAHFEVRIDDGINALTGYATNNNRSQVVEVGGCEFFMDAYNANPTSMKAALSNFGSVKRGTKRVAILGDMFELGSYSSAMHQEMIGFASDQNFDACFFIGKNFYQWKDTFPALQFFVDKESFLESVDKSLFKEAIILVKGSRSMALESLPKLLI